MLYHIPVRSEHVRTIVDPNVKGARTIYALVQLTDLPQLPLDPDPRVPKQRGPVVNRISKSVVAEKGTFHLLNRGITVSAETAEYDTRTGILRLNLPDDSDAYGILDGGHTDYAIRTTVSGMTDERRDLLEEFVRLEIMVGIESHLADIAEARNYSQSLKEYTLDNYRGEFNWLLEALGPGYREYVKASENDEQPVSVVDVIQILSAVNPYLFPETKAPVEAYKNAGKCLEWFTHSQDAYGYKKMESIALTVLKLYDYCRLRWKDAYNQPDDTGRRGKFGRKAEASIRKRGRQALSTFYFYQQNGQPAQGEYPVEKGLALPLLSGFRALLLEDSAGQINFYTDPFNFFDEYGKKLVSVIMTASDNAGNNPQIVGRDPQVYHNMYSEVRRWYLESQFATRTATANRLPL